MIWKKKKEMNIKKKIFTIKKGKEKFRKTNKKYVCVLITRDCLTSDIQKFKNKPGITRTFNSDTSARGGSQRPANIFLLKII